MWKESITYALQNFCRHLVFPSNCHLTLTANYSFLMVSYKTYWVLNSSLMVDYNFSMVSCRNDLVKSSSLMVGCSFSMVSCMNGLVKSFWMG